MPLVFVQAAQLTMLNDFLASFTFWARLYQNDRVPARTDHVGLYVEATFSGYAGPLQLIGWTPATIVALHALSIANGVSWLHNGGPIDNNIFGVFVTDGAGDLVWAERNPTAPIIINPANRVYSYTASLTDTNEFGG